MRIDKKLNLVVTLERDEGTVYVHCVPLPREVIEQYKMSIAKAFAGILQQNLSYIAGPQTSMVMLKRAAEELGDSVEL